MINGLHAVIFSQQAEQAREFVRDVLGFDSVDAGGGWLIFGPWPSEVAVHPSEDGAKHELYLMCDDLEATAEELRAKGAELGDVSDERWGRLTTIKLPGGGELGLYEPRHPSPIT
jgi:catechol 2,3-dioxygenase-like lactoylglutathione lyase family enzyme